MTDQVSDPGAGRDPERQQHTQPSDARPRMNLQRIQSWVDLEIEQAQRRGDFDNLPGAGKPLKNVEQPDPDWWVKGLIEREKLDLSAALPTVMALRQERCGFPESLAGIADEVAVRERLADYNARVLADRRTPAVGPNSPAIAGRVDVEEMVARWRELRADRERPIAPEGATVLAMGAEAGPAEAGDGGVRRVVPWLGLIAVLLVAGIWFLVAR